MPTSDFIQQIKEEKNRVPFLFIEEIGDFSSDFRNLNKWFCLFYMLSKIMIDINLNLCNYCT